MMPWGRYWGGGGRPGPNECRLDSVCVSVATPPPDRPRTVMSVILQGEGRGGWLCLYLSVLGKGGSVFAPKCLWGIIPFEGCYKNNKFITSVTYHKPLDPKCYRLWVPLVSGAVAQASVNQCDSSGPELCHWVLHTIHQEFSHWLGFSSHVRLFGPLYV